MTKGETVVFYQNWISSIKMWTDIRVSYIERVGPKSVWIKGLCSVLAWRVIGGFKSLVSLELLILVSWESVGWVRAGRLVSSQLWWGWCSDSRSAAVLHAVTGTFARYPVPRWYCRPVSRPASCSCAVSLLRWAFKQSWHLDCCSPPDTELYHPAGTQIIKSAWP